MNYNESIYYKGYEIIKRKSICDDVLAYYSIKLNGKTITIASTIQIAKIIINERIAENGN